jgi:hypothetical protein
MKMGRIPSIPVGCHADWLGCLDPGLSTTFVAFPPKNGFARELHVN